MIGARALMRRAAAATARTHTHTHCFYSTLSHKDKERLVNEKNEELVKNFERLSDSVSSSDAEHLQAKPTDSPFAASSKRPLPQARVDLSPDLYSAQAGRWHAQQIHEIFRLRRADPHKWSVDALAQRFHVDGEHLRAMLQHSCVAHVGTVDDHAFGYWVDDPLHNEP